VCGGDHKASRMYLVNLQKLFSSDVIKAFKEAEKNEKESK
jgi:rubrerythrin